MSKLYPKTIFFCCLSIFVLLLTSCSQPGGGNSQPGGGNSQPEVGKLTVAKAQNALNKWTTGNKGTISIQGIQEIPQNNTAKASLVFNNYSISVESHLNGRLQQANYSGPGFAIFTKFNDGRWLLTEIQTTKFGGQLMADHDNTVNITYNTHEQKWSEINIEVQ